MEIYLAICAEIFKLEGEQFIGMFEKSAFQVRLAEMKSSIPENRNGTFGKQEP